MSDTSNRPAGRHLSSCSDEPDRNPRQNLDQNPCPEQGLSIDVLGPLRVTACGREVSLSSRRQRTLLVLFVMNANSVVTAERLIDHLWDGAPPPGASVTLRSYVSHLRKVLDIPTGAQARITTIDAGYRLDVDESRLDLARFRQAIAAGHQHRRLGENNEATAAFEEGLGMWRGQPLAELADHGAVAGLLAELAELHTGATESRLHALVDTGRHLEAVPALESLVASEPLREGPHELLMLSLYRSGRSADALSVYRRFRDLLREQLGLDPSTRLDQLVSDILNRHPRLDPPPDTQTPRTAGKTTPAADAEPTAAHVLMLIQTLREVSKQMTAFLDAVGAPHPEEPAQPAHLLDLVDAVSRRLSGAPARAPLAS